MTGNTISGVHRAVLAAVLLAGSGLIPIASFASAQDEASGSDDGGMNESPSEVESTVLERAQERWDRLVEGDIGSAYEFTSPAYRTRTPLQRFRAQFGNDLRWTEAEVTDAQCEGERCEVNVDVTYSLPREGITHTRAISETWILAEDEWWVRLNR